MKRIIVVIVTAFLFSMEALAQSSISTMMDEGLSELDKGNLKNAESIFEKAIEYLESQKQTNTADYATCLHNMGRCCAGQKQFSKGKDYSKRAMELRKKLLGELNDDYILSLNNYANYFCWEEDYKSAWKLQQKAVQLCEKLDHKHPKEFLIYDNMARYCVLANDANNCLKYWEVALSHVKKYSKDYENILKMLDTAAASERITDAQVMERIMQLLGDYNEHEANRKDHTPEELPDMANWYALQGDLDKAREIYSNLLKMDLDAELKKKAERSYASFCSTFLRDRASAAEHYIIASEIELNTKGKTDEYNNMVYMAYLCYKLAKNRLMAENCRLRAVEYIDLKNQEAANRNNDTRSMEQIAEEHLKYNLNYLKIQGKYISELEYARILGSLCGCYKEKGDFANAVDYAEQYVAKLRDALRDRFRTLDYSKRQALWEEEKYNVRNIQELFAMVEAPGLHDRMSTLMYDLQLLSKGILLNSAISLSNVIEMSGDEKLKTDYRSIQELEEQLSLLRSKEFNDANKDAILQTSASLADLQLNVYQRCAEFADYTNYMSYTWKDVQKKLGKDDVAIEFALVGKPDELISIDKNMHALILTKDMTHPVDITLSKMREFMQLPSLDKTDFTKIPKKKPEQELGKLLWEPLTEYLKGKKRVYFSADDMFNCMGIEYFNYGTSIMSEQFEMYRLSSTKELCTQRKSSDKANIVLIGGVDYGKMASTVNEGIHERLTKMRGFRESDEGFAELPFAMQEIEQINDVYKKSNPVLLKDKDATEEAFRLLDNKTVTMLHISTHGSYISYKYDTVADAMNNSILALSGANEGSEDENNDGIISAADIAGMNLRYCDMAVLSACQTGLGKQGDDGVFGLQRGFKNAGVHTLLITLSSVNDETTALLMEQFHKNLSSGKMTKYKALTAAQQYLIAQGYKDPKYWSTFILVDAIN